nr:uncharacterized protein LOC111507360 [Leptinotarsa decemlineata]
MFSCASSRLALISLGCFFLSCGAQFQNQNLLYGKLDAEIKEDPLQCYDCNSEYDPRCGDPFNSYTIGIINCTDRKTPEHLLNPDNMYAVVKPTLCRKIVQTVEGKVRVIRGCGYIRDEHDDKKCYRRTGTKNVEVFHCSCTKSLCNTANPIQSSTSVIITVILAITMSFRGYLFD